MSTDTDKLDQLEREAAEAQAKATAARSEIETMRAKVWDRQRHREADWDKSFVAQLTARNLRQELLGVEEDARQRMRAAIADGDFNAALKAFTDERAARWRQMRLSDEGNAADGRVGGLGDRFQPVGWRDPRFYEVVLDVVEETAQARAEDEIDELHAQRDAYVRGERVELPMSGGDEDAQA